MSLPRELTSIIYGAAWVPAGGSAGLHLLAKRTLLTPGRWPHPVATAHQGAPLLARVRSLVIHLRSGRICNWYP